VTPNNPPPTKAKLIGTATLAILLGFSAVVNGVLSLGGGDAFSAWGSLVQLVVSLALLIWTLVRWRKRRSHLSVVKRS